MFPDVRQPPRPPGRHEADGRPFGESHRPNAMGAAPDSGRVTTTHAATRLGRVIMNTRTHSGSGEVIETRGLPYRPMCHEH